VTGVQWLVAVAPEQVEEQERTERALLGAMMSVLGRIVERRLPTYRGRSGRSRR
jgi:hypothetical protein